MTSPEPSSSHRRSSEAGPRPASLRSLPRNSPNPSPSPRLPPHRGSGSPSASAPRSRLPSTEIPHPQRTATPTLQEESTIKAPRAAPPPQPRPFQPLFTLVSDATGPAAPQTHHPRVHYVFADDDTELLTEALARGIEGGGVDGGSRNSSSGGGSAHGGPPERAILLDLVPRADGAPGLEVGAASSLSAGWAVTGARVSRMEGGEGVLDAEGGEERPLMLRIEGVSLDLEGAGAGGKGNEKGKAAARGAQGGSPEGEMGSSSGGSGVQESPAEEYGVLMEEFEKRMAVLRKVVEAGEERRRRVELLEAEDETTLMPEEQDGGTKNDEGGD